MIAILTLAVASPAACPVENAHYVLRGLPDITAYFRTVDSGDAWPSHLALAIHSAKNGTTSWWVPWQGGTDGQTHIASTTDVTKRGWRPPNPDDGPRPLGDRPFITTDATYTIQAAVPHRGQVAPAHMLNPESGGAHDPVFPLRQFFDLTSCSGLGAN